MVAQNIFFGVLAAVMVVSAVRVVTTRNVVHAALWLVLVLAGVAAQFILLLAEFTAVTQVLVYIGAVVVLFLFCVMLTRAKIGTQASLDNENRLVAIGTAVVLFVIMAYALLDEFSDTDIRDADGFDVQTTAQVSDSIFSTYIVPFEAVSVLLLAALIGAIVVARRE
jgi:NADH-quinone oxidoreductase subunit J